MPNILHYIAAIILPLLFAITLHEAAHGFVASKLGDKTAYMLGRVTLNPIKHIDFLGTILLPIIMLVMSNFKFAFGWAKPVPINWKNLRKPRRDMALVALSGPAANLLMALFWAFVAKLGALQTLQTSSNSFLHATADYFYASGMFGITINIILFCLNLIPIPPLDGSRVVSSLLPRKAAYHYDKIEPYGIWILLGLLVIGFLGKILLPFVLGLTGLIKMLFGL